MKRIEKTERCPCGSGKLYLICCHETDTKSGILRLTGSETLAQFEQFIQEKNWVEPIYKQVAVLIQERFYQRVPLKMIEDALSIWHSYSSIHLPKIRKPDIILGAIEYLMIDDATIDATANKYHTTTASITKWHELFESFISEDFENQQLTNPPPKATIHPSNDQTAHISNSIIPSLNKENTVNREHAQQLARQAMLESNVERKLILAKDALCNDPHCVDALVILARYESKNIKTQFRHMKRIIEQATEWLGGKPFFEEHKGAFWRIPQTRPYLRARGAYAKMLCDVGLLEEAIEEYHQMLLLNPDDHQGIRYLLLNLLIETNELKTAQKLIDVYAEESTHFIYSRLLCNYLADGFGQHLIPLIKQAINHNPHVVNRFLQHKKPPTFVVEDQVLAGSIEEADEYLMNSFELWVTNQELITWIAKQQRIRID